MISLARVPAPASSRIHRELPLSILATFAATLVVAPVVLNAQVVTQTAGNAAAIAAGVNAYRASLGGLNANVAGSFGSGRREINWDGVPDGLAAPNNLPANFFNANSPRGVTFSTPGTGFQVSANAGNPSGAAVLFGNIDPTYGTSFSTFSPQRLFTALGSNVVMSTSSFPDPALPQ